MEYINKCIKDPKKPFKEYVDTPNNNKPIWAIEEQAKNLLILIWYKALNVPINTEPIPDIINRGCNNNKTE